MGVFDVGWYKGVVVIMYFFDGVLYDDCCSYDLFFVCQIYVVEFIVCGVVIRVILVIWQSFEGICCQCCWMSEVCELFVRIFFEMV